MRIEIKGKLARIERKSVRSGPFCILERGQNAVCIVNSNRPLGNPGCKDCVN
jgi:hypothetical protein